MFAIKLHKMCLVQGNEKVCQDGQLKETLIWNNVSESIVYGIRYRTNLPHSVMAYLCPLLMIRVRQSQRRKVNLVK